MALTKNAIDWLEVVWLDIKKKLMIDGVEITANATELNKLDGLTASTAELNILDGVTASTAELNILDGVTATAAELNKTDGLTAGTGQLNLALAYMLAGKKIAFGVKAIGAAQEDVQTGLSHVDYALCSLVGAPSTTHMFSVVTVGDQAGAPAEGYIRINSYKPTAVNDVTPTAAASVFANVAWVAVGS